MTDFLKINLEHPDQPANIRLRDEQKYGDLVIVQAHFNTDGATINYLRSDRKPKEYNLTTEEATAFVAAWTEYQARIVEHKTEQEAREKAMIAEAKALASSTTFDLKSLNVQISEGKDEDGYWFIHVPAINAERHCSTVNLKETVQEVLDDLERDIKRAEKYHWHHDSAWKEIVASYRRVFPLPEQGEALKVKVNLQAPEPIETGD